VLGILYASESAVAFTITMTRIVCLLVGLSNLREIAPS
jgi:hypothetical protein